jgi:hypothetical protein
MNTVGTDKRGFFKFVKIRVYLSIPCVSVSYFR